MARQLLSLLFLVIATTTILLCLTCSAAFVTPSNMNVQRRSSSLALPLSSWPLQQSQQQSCTATTTTTLQATRPINDDEDNDENNDNENDLLDARLSSSNENNQQRRRPSPRQSRSMAGGRRRARKQQFVPSVTSNRWLVRAGLLPLLVVAALFVKSLFGTGGGDASQLSSSPSYFYYQSSYYESRVYTDNGNNMERTVRKSVQSNVPSLIQQQQLEQQRQTDEEEMTSTYLLRDSPDRGLDQELDAALIKVQQAMFADWF